MSGTVRAETPPSQTENPNAFIPSDNAAAAHKSVEVDATGRWSLRLDMDPAIGQGMAVKDVSAGAYFHITPSMRVGGTVGLGDRQADAQKILPSDANAPRVHLETKFKF
jgi:hypothetical protein